MPKLSKNLYIPPPFPLLIKSQYSHHQDSLIYAGDRNRTRIIRKNKRFCFPFLASIESPSGSYQCFDCCQEATKKRRKCRFFANNKLINFIILRTYTSFTQAFVIIYHINKWYNHFSIIEYISSN